MRATATPRRFLLDLFVVTMAVAGSALSGAGHVAAAGFLPADRSTTWKPGLMGVGGIPVRSTICATLTPGGGTSDDTARIQVAINSCPVGEEKRYEPSSDN